MQKILIQIIIISLLSACSIYRADEQQGNLVSDKDVKRLHLGMNKNEVQRVLGTPLLMHAFTRDRWDYYYSLKQSGKLVKKTNLTLEFMNGRLSRISGEAAE